MGSSPIIRPIIILMFRKVIEFIKDYKQFSLVVLSILVALPLYISGSHDAAQIILSMVAIANVIPIVVDMLREIRSGTYGVDLLAATAITTAVIFGEYWAGMIILVMLLGGEALENYAANRAKTELNALLSSAPKKAHVLRGRKVVDVLASDVKVNDKVLIKAGEQVPVDAVVIDGSASFDESSLTGESLPSDKQVGEELLSGSINLDGVVTARALRVAKDSQFEQIVQMVAAAASSKSPFIRVVDRYSIPFTILSFTIAIGAWVLSGESIRFLEVMVVATPCPLILAAPIALISGMSRSAKHGIIIKNGAALERLADINTLALDKTGTLTRGQLVLERVETFGKFKAQEMLSFAAAAEHNSNHLLAKAIVNEAQRKKLKLPKAKNINDEAGLGLSASVQGKEVLVGRAQLLSEHSVPMQKITPDGTVVFVAINKQFAGTISFKDEIRPESQRTLSKLKSLGIKHFLMITGDTKATADKIAKQLDIDEVYAGALPADKLKIVEGAKPKPVGFVGDGVNDAPVLAAADVGIALGARGSAAASESADVVIMLDDIERVAVGVSIAKRTFFIAKQSIWIGISLSVLLMAIFSTGRFKPIYGAAIQETVDVIVIFNALRAHGASKKAVRQTAES